MKRKANRQQGRRRFGVSIPVTGTVYVEVVAASEDEAIEAALVSTAGLLQMLNSAVTGADQRDVDLAATKGRH